MTKGLLIQAMNEFLEQEDDEYLDEAYQTEKQESTHVMDRFRKFLIEKGYL